MRFNQYINIFSGRLFFKQQIVNTKGMGKLANQALYRAKKIIHIQRKINKKTHNKLNVPEAKRVGCYAKLQKSRNSNFDYWVLVLNQWTRKRVALPAKSHKVLNRALKQGWKFTSLCECKLINGNLYAIVFVKKTMPKAKKYKRVTGYDVGIKHSVVSSKGYLGYGLSKVMKVQKRRHAERRRQGNKISNRTKTCIKQILDREAKLAIRRSITDRAHIAVESPKRLANLRAGSLQGWARGYFANRLDILGKESGIRIIEISPYQTSITCPKCRIVDKRSRVTRDTFRCVKCNYTNHADKVAALNVALKGTLIIRKRKHPVKDEQGAIRSLLLKKLGE
jgi:transposase